MFAIFLKEGFSAKRIAFGLVSVSGVILIIQPELIFGGRIGDSTGTLNVNSTLYNESKMEMDSHQDNNTEAGNMIIILGYTIPVIQGISLSCLVVLLKRRAHLNEHMMEVLFGVSFLAQ